MKHLLRNTLLGAAALLASVSAQAIPVTGLGFAIDGSGSVGAADFQLQLQGLSSAISNPAIVPQNSTVEISVIQFGTSTLVEVSPTVIDSQATATAVANQILGIGKQGGGTPMSTAINLTASTLLGSPNAGDAGSVQLINIVTDGVPNNQAATTAAAAAAQAAGIEGLSAEAVGQFANPAFLATIVFPGVSPGPIIALPAAIPDPRVQGFVLNINSFQDFGPAIASKIAAATGRVPEPGTVMLLATGLIGFGLARRKRS